MGFEERANGGPGDPFAITLTLVNSRTKIEPSHGDGFGGLTDEQRRVYAEMLREGLRAVTGQSAKLPMMRG